MLTCGRHGHAAMNGSDSALAVSVEVDGRQRYLFETDKLREMLGASLVVKQTVEEAEALFAGPDLHLFSPVSGEIRAWAPAAGRDRLFDAAWALSRRLDERGVQHRVVMLETELRHLCSDYGNLREEVHGSLNKLARDAKGRKGGIDARPTCSLFANCEVLGIDPANYWTPGQFANEPRRQLVGHRAHEKLDTWHRGRRAFYADLLLDPVAERIERETGGPVDRSALRTRVTFSDLADALDDEGPRDDQYIAFICADGDGTGRLLGRIDWNSTAWQDGRQPWERNERFVRALDSCVQRALGHAIAFAAITPNQISEIKDAISGDHEINVELNLLPQLRGGEDVWLVANRACALELAIAFEEKYRVLADDDETLSRALEIASEGDAPEALTISFGIAFAKSGLPAHAMIEAAESLLRSAKTLRKSQTAKPVGCIDWHWIQSSLAETVDDARRAGYSYRYSKTPPIEAKLTSLPWTASETQLCMRAADLLGRPPGSDGGLARRKREQIDSILRYGDTLTDLAWTSWWNGLGDGERKAVVQARDMLPDRVRPSGDPVAPWIAEEGDPVRTTPFVDLLTLSTKIMPTAGADDS